MSQTAFNTADYAASPWMAMGVVRNVRDTVFEVVGDRGLLRARRAVDCLLEPRPGDRVLLLLDSRSCYILHILDRTDSDAEATVLLPSRTTVRTAASSPAPSDHNGFEQTGSALHLVSGNVQLSGNQLDLQAKVLTARAETLSFTATAMRFAGRSLTRSFATAHSLFTHLFEKAQRAIGHYGTSIQQVQELDETTAGRQRITVRESLRIRSGSASLRAEESVDVDGKNIKIG